MIADEIPVAHTPEGGWHGDMPPPVLAGCTHPLEPGAPDLRGLWRAYAVEQNGQEVHGHRLNEHVERIEQCGNRIVVTAGHMIHDMRAAGTLERGVDDVIELDLNTRIRVEVLLNGVLLDLHPGGIEPGRPPLVTREILDGDLVWHYATFTVRMHRVDIPYQL